MESIINYLFELGALKYIKRSGWWLAKVKDPESVAEHSFRAAAIAFILSKLEGETDETASKLCSAAVFHDVHETRILDLNKVTARYIDNDEAAEQVEKEQIESLPSEVRDSIQIIISKLSEREKIILKDADRLEMALQAKEYVEIGYEDAKEWLTAIEKRLKTESAKKLFGKMKTIRSNEWYKDLKKLEK